MDALSAERLAEIKRDWPTLTIVQELLTAYDALLREQQAMDGRLQRAIERGDNQRNEREKAEAQLAAAEARVSILAHAKNIMRLHPDTSDKDFCDVLKKLHGTQHDAEAQLERMREALEDVNGVVTWLKSLGCRFPDYDKALRGEEGA